MSNVGVMALDVGAARIGVATADLAMRIAVPRGVVIVDGNEAQQITELCLQYDITTVVVGYPRNQSGEATAQTETVETFVSSLDIGSRRLVFQDESLTSVLAENRLRATHKPYQKADIDAEAAVIILEDYLEHQP